jgi:hypothetical protein
VKIWFGHGSEHSANLIMIGRFADARKANAFVETVRLIQEQVREDDQSGRLDWDRPEFSDQALQLLARRKAHSLGPTEIVQFALDYSLDVQDSEVTVKTDEIDVSGLLKLMIDGGAKVEIYSAHEWPDRRETASEKPTSSN